ncbi:MAG: hypothetical protein U0790_20905 [Isosphaeraceae bacterium]
MSGRIRRAGYGIIGLVGLGLIGFMAISAASASPGFKVVPLEETARGAKPQEPAPDLEIHEWGTFLGMSGSDGSTLDGMYHEEHALPAFVHSRDRDQLRLPFSFLKGETPVIYFYTERPQSVRLGVGFPQGIWTHWYPQAAWVKPTLEERATGPERLRNGRVCWTVDILPARAVERARASGGNAPAPPETSSDALWNFSRDVDAAFVRTMDTTSDPPRPEYERFLFYRGLSEARLPLRISARDGGTVSLDRDPLVRDGVQHVFVLRVENGRAAYRYLPKIEPGQSLSGVIPGLEGARPVEEFARNIADDLAGRLSDAGLFAREARAMVNTWNTSYFQNEGIRVLFVLPQRWTDAFIPMTVNPAPKRIVRVMIGRQELLSPERERLAEEAVRGLASPEEAVRLEAFARLRSQGRYVEPIVRRVLRTTADPNVRLLCRRLLTADEITTLRAAAHSAADGKMLNEDPLMLRALLARLLREVGLDHEARGEAVAILNQLERNLTLPKPVLERREIRAAALEASALDDSAAQIYEEVVRKTLGTFGNEVSPETVTWCREWWVGRAYARCLARCGGLEAAVTKLEVGLPFQDIPGAGSEARVTRILLAYLREAQGKHAEADALWSCFLPPPQGGTRVAARRIEGMIPTLPSLP